MFVYITRDRRRRLESYSENHLPRLRNRNTGASWIRQAMPCSHALRLSYFEGAQKSSDWLWIYYGRLDVTNLYALRLAP